MKNTRSKQELFTYYNERAPEYEAFYRGQFPDKTVDPAIYKNDTLAIQRLLPGYVSGRCIDIACGTGFWLPVYEKNCSRITMIDQSESVLAECAKKIQRLGIESKTETVCGDLFKHPFKAHQYDTALMGFLISHFQGPEMDRFFTVLKTLLAPRGRFLIIDSLWSDVVEAMGRNKTGMVERFLFDGRKFEIYKQFFSQKALDVLSQKFSLDMEIVYWGKVFFLSAGRFTNS
jgi:ubiquinone/menaquinone biosynthesis C-methylase UbiE